MSESNIEIEKLKDSLKSVLNAVAVPLKEIDFTKENYNKLFPRSRIKTPIENVKLGANQFEKLEKKERQKILQAVHDTLATPDVVINEEKEDVFGEKENSHLYAKSYIIDEKIHGIQSVVVSIDGESVSISTHERDINNIVNKIKKPDQLLYAAAKVRLLVEQHTEIPQSVVNPNRDSEYVASPTQNISQNQILSTSTEKTGNAKRKIYLSGKITGDEGFAEKFKAKEEELSARGDYVFNPALHPDMFTHRQFMQIDLLALSFCDSIYLMNNWRDSKGAIMEFEQARALGIPCEFEEKNLCLLRHYEGGNEEVPTYYSAKKDEFIDLEDITADDFFDSNREAEEKVWSAFDWNNGNVQVVSAEEIFGNKKDISLEQTIKNEKDISKVQSAVQAALEENAVPFSKIEPLDERDMARLKINGTIETTRGTLRLSKADLASKNRPHLLAYADTLRSPDAILEKETFDEKTETFKPIEVFVKSFSRQSGAIEPVILYLDRMDVTVGTKNNDFKKFVSQIRSSDQISYLDKRIGEAVARSLRGGASREHSQDEIGGKAEKSSSEKKKVSLDLGKLFNTFREENGYEPTTLIEFGKPYDYLSLSRGVQIRHSVDDGMDYYDLIDKEYNILCYDGETCEVVSQKSGEYTLLSEDSDIPFVLSEKEFKYASQKINIEERFSPESAIASYLKDIQTLISGNNYSDSYVLNLSKNILFNRGETLHLESAKNDYTKSEIKEIKDGLKALKVSNPKKLVDVLKNTDPNLQGKLKKTAVRKTFQNNRIEG